jgi:hypothetical protein
LVVVSVPDYATALTLTGDDQQTIGLYCGDTFATINQPLRACNSPRSRATLIHIAAPGTYNADTNSSRIAPHDLLDVALGSQVCGRKSTIVNLSDRVALYNFLSSFSGAHFITPRTAQEGADVTILSLQYQNELRRGFPPSSCSGGHRFESKAADWVMRIGTARSLIFTNLRWQAITEIPFRCLDAQVLDSRLLSFTCHPRCQSACVARMSYTIFF